jgi:hypothetical protein
MQAAVTVTPQHRGEYRSWRLTLAYLTTHCHSTSRVPSTGPSGTVGMWCAHRDPSLIPGAPG